MRLEKWWCQDCSTPDGVYEIDETLYQDDSAELTGRGDIVRSGQSYKRKQDPHSRESTPSTDSHDSDDNDESDDSDDSDDRDDSDNSDDTSSSNHKRKREQELELTESSTS